MLGTVLFYTFICIFVYVVSDWLYKRSGRHSCRADGSVVLKKMPLLMALAFSLLCMSYNIYVTETSTMMGGDRTNYQYTYEYERINESIGLTLLMNIGRMYEIPFFSLLYFSTFFSMLMVFLAYRHSREATPYALLLFFLSFYLNESLTAMKQCYAMGCSTLLFSLLLQKHTILKDVLSIMLIIVACAFHSTGFILIPLYVVLRINSKYISIGKVLPILILVVMLFMPMMRFIGSLTGDVFSMLAGKADQYFGSGEAAESGLLVTLKGLPFYYISAIAIKYRKRLANKIPDFNKYLLLSLMGSLFYLLSFYDVWMSRFEYSFSFIILVFWAKVLDFVQDKITHKIVVMSLLVFFTYRHLILIYINFGGF